ncbi:HET-domain-containing protein [Venturia nashicola]|nr:HET-domain-containing protein [Venturia nashicola]
MSKAFLRDTVIGSSLDLPSGKNVPVSRWKRLWDFTGGAFVDGLKDEPPVESTPRHRSGSNGYKADENHENTETGPPFCYDSLPDSRKHIRLLQILPGMPQDDVRCLIYPVALEDCPEYEALSYCWGNVTERTPILINEYSLDITRSLRSALFHLRKLHEPRTIWVDAVCINQGDVIERGNQVSIMGDIYGHTTRTVVWLGSGDGDEDSKRAFKICEQLAKEAIMLESNLDPSTDKLSFPEYDKNDSCLDNLVDDCPWWRRVWIVQEIILATDALLVCGSNEIDWKVFCRAMDRLISAQLTNGVVMGLIEQEPFRWYQSINSIRSLSLTDSLGDKLLDLLIHVREREATNPRDKVFSVLGLMDGKSEAMGITPDYTGSTEEVFNHTATCILKHSSTLDVLGLAPTNAKKLPSWVPSWVYDGELPKPMRFDARGNIRSTHASRSTSPHLEFREKGSILILSAQHIDSISDLADVLPIFDKEAGWEEIPDPDEDAGAIEWFRSAFADIGQASGHMLAITNRLRTFISWENFVGNCKNQEMSYWQTISGGCGLDDPASMEILYRKWFASLSPIRSLMRWRVDRVTTNSMFKSLGFVGYLKSTWNSYPEFGMLVEAQAAGRRLARAAKGSLCLVPANAKQGDSIILAKGGRVPLVVRRSESEETASESWTLVGECYLHGVMNGGAFREEDCVDICLY